MAFFCWKNYFNFKHFKHISLNYAGLLVTDCKQYRQPHIHSRLVFHLTICVLFSMLCLFSPAHSGTWLLFF